MATLPPLTHHSFSLTMFSTPKKLSHNLSLHPTKHTAGLTRDKVSFLKFRKTSVVTSCTKSLPEPINIDWCERGAVNPVRHQSNCNSCFAMSAISAVETIQYIKNGLLLKLSPQEFLDCGEWDVAIGGDFRTVWKYIIDNGISLEKNYPYEARRWFCRKRYTQGPRFTIDGFVRITIGDLDQMCEVIKSQTLVASFFLHKTFVEYKGGVYEGPTVLPRLLFKPSGTNYDPEGYMRTSDGTLVSHCMTIVGAFTTQTKDVWKLQGSWGPAWGEKGFMLMVREKGYGSLGFNMRVAYPILL